MKLDQRQKRYVLVARFLQVASVLAGVGFGVWSFLYPDATTGHEFSLFESLLMLFEDRFGRKERERVARAGEDRPARGARDRLVLDGFVGRLRLRHFFFESLDADRICD